MYVRMNIQNLSFLSLALPENCEFVVNFAPELAEVTSEAKYLEKLGFPVPDLARSVALQEEKFIAFQDGLNHVLHRYHHVLSTLTEAEVCNSIYVPLMSLVINLFGSYSLSCWMIM